MTNYDVLSWNAMPLYQCRLCPYDTLVESEMIEHQANVHAPAPKPVMVQVQVLDRFGNVVEGQTVEVPADQPAEVKRSGIRKLKEGPDAENHAD